MRVTVRYHALLREKVGRDAETLEIAAAQACVKDVIDAFVHAHPTCEKIAPALNIALNEEMVRHDALVRDGDTLDLMPPFGGG
jgi:molybdopterin converting factor small subunit